MVKFRIFREWNEVNSKITILGIRETDFDMFRDLCSEIIWEMDLETRFSHLPPSSSGMVHPNKQKIKLSWSEVGMDEQVDSDKNQTWKRHIQEEGNNDRSPVKNIKILHYHQGVRLGIPKPTWRWIWLGIWRVSKRKSKDNLCPLLNEAGVLVQKDTKKVRVLNELCLALYS